MSEWVYDPKWGYTLAGERVWVEWWLVGADILKSVYTTESCADISRKETH